jgi:hypothetical protein
MNATWRQAVALSYRRFPFNINVVGEVGLEPSPASKLVIPMLLAFLTLLLYLEPVPFHLQTVPRVGVRRVPRGLHLATLQRKRTNRLPTGCGGDTNAQHGTQGLPEATGPYMVRPSVDTEPCTQGGGGQVGIRQVA